MKGKALIGILICSIMASLGVATSTPQIKAEANSAQSHWEGVSATGAIVMDETCPIEVQHERLVLDLPTFPSNYYSTMEEFLAYDGKVTAEYTFYNPEDYTVKATLAFPFGRVPYYGNTYDPETGKYNAAADTEKYDVTVNGAPVEKEIRYTLAGYFEDFNIDKDLPQMRNEYVEDEFYTPLMPVTRYSYHISGIDEELGSVYAACTYKGDASKNRIWVNTSGIKQVDDQLVFGSWVSNGAAITVYVIGEPLKEDLEWTIYEHGTLKNEIPGCVVHSEKNQTMTFEEFVYTCYFGEYQRQGEISQHDWYNAVVYSLNECLREEYGVITYAKMNAQTEFMRWYQYELEIPPKSTVINAVTAPIYPSITTNYTSPLYGYTYLLSPAKTWRKFGKLDIEIHTPYYLIKDKDGFVKTDYGYALSLDGLPKEELEFTLSAEENPKSTRSSGCGLLFILMLMVPISYLIDIGQELVGCVSVITSCGVFGSIFITMAVLLFKKRK